MGYVLLTERRMTVEEYFELEEQSELRHEFYDGEVYAMSGTTLNHNSIVGNLWSVFRSFFRQRGCRVFGESIKLKVSDRYYLYPDIIVTCVPKDTCAAYIIEQPIILVEVSSKSTDAKDRGVKLKQYKTIPSLQYYLLVSQREYSVELFSRVEATDLWTYRSFESVTDVIRFDTFNFEIALQAIYDDIDFATSE